MTTPATPAAVTSLDAVIGKIDALLTPAAPVSMTQAQLNEHVSAELEKALGDAAAGKADLHKARLEHLKAQVAAAKAVYDSGATLAPIVMFKDPWQMMPNSGATKSTVDVPQSAITPTGDSNIQFTKDVVITTEKGELALSPTFKALFSIASAAPESELRKALVAKAGAEVAPVIIAKAGEAMACLQKIASVFNYTPEPGSTLLDCDFRWSVGDTISALQSAARTENVITQMSSLLTKNIAPIAPPAPAATPTAKSDVEDDFRGGWPLDMAKETFDEKSGLSKAKGDEKDGELYWGRDSQKAPTT